MDEENIVISNIKGGLGNQLFQYATGLSVALKNNATFKVDLGFFDNPRFINAFRLDHLNFELLIAEPDDYKILRNSEEKITVIHRVLNKFRIPNKFNKPTHLIDPTGHEPSNRIIHAKPPVYIEGWCIKEVYFSDIREHLVTIFKPKSPLTSNAQRIKNEIIHCNSVSIHIRRCDYVENSLFVVVPFEYYLKAISRIKKSIDNPVFFVFSDDLEWVKENFLLKENIRIVDLKEGLNYNGACDMEDFSLMKTCRHNIIANSSFSWWAAYLNCNPNKIVVSPKIWYKDKVFQNSLLQGSFIPKEWILI